MCKQLIFSIFMFLIFITLSAQQPVKAKTLYNPSKELEDDGNQFMLKVPDEHCGFDSGYYYNETIGKCVIKPSIMRPVTYIYKHDENMTYEGSLANSVRKEGNYAFKGITIAAIIIITFAVLCVLSSCIYCCRISYSDYLLSKECKALAKKIGRGKSIMKTTKRPTTIQPVADSCPVIIEETGLYVV